MASYIAFLDLLGTKNACKDPSVYFEHINAFSKAVKETSWNLEGVGTVGIFSDSAYVESSDLEQLLDFLIQLRIRLISVKVFFNAVVKKGKLMSKSLVEGSHLIGVTFSHHDIADLYISQTKFNGIGIYIDKPIEDEIENTRYTMNDCVFVQCEHDVNKNQDKYYPVQYKDISFYNTLPYKKIEEILIEIILKMMYSSYLQSPRYGRYYISILSNLLRSYINGFKWNKAQKQFSDMPLPFEVIHNMLKNHYSKLADLPGIEYLALIMLDIIYNSDELSIEDQIGITKLFTSYDCIKNTYIHSLDKIPSELFTSKSGTNSSNREIFVQFCKNDLSCDFVDEVMRL